MALGMADLDVTNMAAGFDPYGDSSKLVVHFHMHPVQDEAASIAAGRPIFKEVEYIRIQTPGDKDNIIDRETWAQDHVRFAKQYADWKSGTKTITGTPLDVLTRLVPPLLNPSQVEEFKVFAIRTAEDLVGMPDGLAQKFMGIEILKRRIRGWLDMNASGEAARAGDKYDAELKKRDAEVAELRAMVEALTRKEKVKAEK